MRQRSSVWAFACFFISASAVAASPPGDHELIRERQEQLLQQQRQRLQELQQLPGPAPAAPAAQTSDDEPCFSVEQVEISGASLLSEADREALLAPFSGDCLGVTRLDALLRAITHHYIDHGHATTRAYLPQQDLSAGTLKIRVVEGRIEGFDSSAMASERELLMSFPGETGTILDLRELEQLLDNLNRLPSRPAQLELVPGQQVGGSRVGLKGERSKPWHANINRHNDGQRSTGEQQWGLGLTWDSPLGLADQLSLRASRDAVSDSYRHSHSQSLHYSVPYGWWRFDYRYNQSYYRTRGLATGVAFEQDGDSQTHLLRGERTLHRNNVSKTAFSLGLSHVRSRNYLLDTLLDRSSPHLSEAQLGFNHGRRVGSAFVNADIGWQRGIGLFGAQSDTAVGTDDPVARYDKYSLTLSYLQPFTLGGERFSIDSLATGQKSEDVLYSPQRISIGGLGSVRGFKDQSLLGDSGGYWRNQLRWTRPVTWAPLQPFIQQYGAALAFDVGVISGDRHNSGASGRMSGHALELSAQGKHLAASLTFAHSLERPSAIDDDERPVYLRLDLFF